MDYILEMDKTADNNIQVESYTWAFNQPQFSDVVAWGTYMW